jgi:ketosteroid isomerase-like protein
MIDTTDIDRWLERYQAAWRSDEPTQIAALFTDDARYFIAPQAEPMVGAAAVADWWREMGESRLPWTFEYDVVAREGDLHVVRATTRYPEGTSGETRPTEFRNLWLVTLAGGGRAREFIEYYVEVE